MKIGFVTPWYGETIPGGAEMALRGISRNLQKAGIDVEILTTCVKEFSADWNMNYHKPGLSDSEGMPVRRFKVRKRNKYIFDSVNGKLMKGIRVTEMEERLFIREMINSPDLYEYMELHQREYDVFVFIPYMFGTTYYGIQVCPQKAVMIPCFHDEAYAYMTIFKELYSQVAGMAFNAEPERLLTDSIYDTSHVIECVPGLGLDTNIQGDERHFREKYKIKEPFILYAGRKDSGKNVHTLLWYYKEYCSRHPDTELKMVLIGGGRIDIPEGIEDNVYDLGFVDIQDKYDAYSAAEFLCQPSKNESFSLVIMESWLCHRPVLVHEECEVTKHFAQVANGGLYFKDYFEFEACTDYYLNHPEHAGQMGKQGRSFVLDNFTWDEVTRKYIELFQQVIAKNKEKEV